MKSFLLNLPFFPTQGNIHSNEIKPTLSYYKRESHLANVRQNEIARIGSEVLHLQHDLSNKHDHLALLLFLQR
jgi:hypothetical protein